MIRIFALPSHATKDRVSGVDFARILQPMNYLKMIKGFQVALYDVQEPTPSSWIDICQKHDLIFFNYTIHDWAFAAMGCMARKYGVKMVCDLDDAIWNILPDNPAYQAFKDGGAKILSSILNEVDYVTTTNSYLKNIIAHNTYKSHDRIKVFPNYIDLDLYNHRAKTKNDYQIVIGHFGSTTHFISLQNENFAKGMDRVMKDYPNVIFKTIGAFIPDYRKRWGMRYDNAFGDIDIYKWIKEKYPQFMDEINFFVVPLAENAYNRAKSSIKWLEVSAAKRCGVWQRIRQYEEVIDEGKTGLLARNADDWYYAMKQLIDDNKSRQTMGQNAFKEVEANWTIQKNIFKYVDFFKAIFAS